LSLDLNAVLINVQKSVENTL